MVGPVVRVGPNELHFSRPDAYNEIYAIGSKFSKDPATYRPSQGNFVVFTIHDASEASSRRGMILPFLSKRAIFDREWIIQREVNNFINTLIYCSSVDIEETARSFMGAVIPSVCFPDFHSNIPLLSSGLAAAVTDSPKTRFPFLASKYVPSKLLFLLRARRVASRQAPGHLYSRAKEGEAYAIMAQQALSTPLSEVRDSNADFMVNLLARSAGQTVPEPKSRWLMAESLNLKYAGMDTTSTAILFIIRGVLANDGVRIRLADELNGVWSDPGTTIRFAALEKLSYLTAVIKEGLRLSVGIFSPMNRVVGPGNAMISGDIIPKGVFTYQTVVGMAHSMIHLNPDIFPNPYVFRPERWLQEDGQKLDKYLMSFGRGPRSCVGIHMAWCVLYLVTANVFRRLDLRPTSMDYLRERYRLKDNFVSVYEGKPLEVDVKLKET
ncbi:hypothetical protein VNI00_000656 [Paramarasmius palmivorus]|uniref:Cytochrome P450 n=1 Tax=Paramarasmius palmivorus TaxID=297713 RepID=A0AAW0E8D7_9AGAR